VSNELVVDGACLTSGEPTDTARSLFFGFSVAERDLNCVIRHWLHPGGTVTGGIVAVQGQVANAACANFIDYRHRTPIPEVTAGGILFPGGLRLEVIEPLRRLQLSYASPDGRFSFRCEQTALGPLTPEPTADHLIQPMEVDGELSLDGERMRIDGYAIHEQRRSRRRETVALTSPLGRGSAIFGPDLAIHFSARDGRSLDRAGLDHGYIWRGDETRTLEAAWMSTGRGSDGTAPAWVEVRLADSGGEIYELAGETRARVPINLRFDLVDQICLMEYRLNGRRCFGDFHDLQPHSFLRTARR
jgi:hypothetical protein